MPDVGSFFTHEISNVVGVNHADRSPNFLSLAVEEDECRGVFKPVFSSQFLSNGVLDIEPDHLDLAFEFSLQPIHDGLCREAGESVIALKFQQDRKVLPDVILNFFNVV